MKTESMQAARKAWMSVLAQADADHLATLWAEFGRDPGFSWLRAPEVGGVMVRGRMGGTGAPFNLGEMTVTRCALSLENGAVGHGYVQGRSKVQAEIAAKVDALMQGAEAAELERVVLTPLRDARDSQKAKRADKAAATKVDFFTLARGED
ncbi:phosphonate C-P lyase system protein PhnG [Epibacterium sp. SM1969]|uniref:Phosphonate C-P lyase system protein PhnG n=1 Tax=Tritonibacter aquimaris TaxID=2663379 RepID=A0A844AV58_9RHOB|nr:phosphonate C-P lyase system protein PhnG [Tritonibacter aquimaris]MQY42294.1 phosphonate C-P lyase system protein PhnG [Tritonibacter aquimaris]